MLLSDTRTRSVILSCFSVSYLIYFRIQVRRDRLSAKFPIFYFLCLIFSLLAQLIHFYIFTRECDSMFKLKDEEAGIFMTWSRLLVSSFLSVGLIEPLCVSFIRSCIDDWANLCSLKIQIYYSLSCEHIDSSKQIGGTDHNRCDRTEVHTDNRSGFDEIACEYMKIFLTQSERLKSVPTLISFPE